MNHDDTQPLLCPAHPHGYHAKPRVNPVGARHVLRHHSLIGLPKRCVVLEDELLETDRELDMQAELAVIERTGAPVRAVLAPLAIAVLITLLLAVDSALVAAPLGALAALVIERIGSAVQAERMRRVVDWRRRVGR